MSFRLSSFVGVVCSVTLAACTGGKPDGACAGSYLYRDADGDGFGDASFTLDGCASRAGYVADATDCDDTDAAAFPGADERCDGLDDDCDGTVDEDALDQTPIYEDLDGDGFGDPASASYVCEVPAGAVTDGSDCDDADADISPAAEEVCDTVDQDCDGEIDEDALDPSTWYADADADGFGDMSAPTLACEMPDGFVADATDCDDAYAAAHPGADENCDGHDEDCDGEVDEGATDPTTWYADADADGFGDAEESTFACTPPDGWVTDAADCDDDDASVFPGAEERCDGVDEDCDTTIDEDAIDPATWYADRDGDGFGDAEVTTAACDAPPDHVADATDCDDGDASVSPGADETCDGADEDCDGALDEDAVDGATWYADLDGDGYGNPASGLAACAAPAEHVSDGSDCDDTSADVSPGVSEAGGNGVDDDCDGAVDTLALADAALTATGPGAGLHAGYGLAAAGDLDGDGAAELLVGSSCGDRAWMLSSAERGVTSLSGASATFTGADACDGITFAGKGDADGDGVADVAFGAAGNDDAGSEAGAVYLLHGGALTGTIALASDVGWAGAASERAGTALDFVGDLDGDGADELLVGAPNDIADGAAPAGTAYLLYDNAGGAFADAGTVLFGEAPGDATGAAVSRAGDFDGDGAPDVAIGAPGADAGEGRVYVVAGAPAAGALSLAAADVRVAGGGIGARLAGGGDVDGDGYDDLLLGAPDADNGRAWLVRGPGAATLDVDALPDSFRGAASGDALGDALALADLDGDGLADVLLGAPGVSASGSSAVGAAYLFAAPSGTLTPTDAALTFFGEEPGSAFGAFAATADLDADGLDDVLLSAWGADTAGSAAGAVYGFLVE